VTWFWIGAAIAVPTVAGFLIALPFWLLRHDIIGNVVGSGVILFGALLSILREYVALRALRVAALKAGKAFHPAPEEFTRYAIYAGIGFAEVFALFIVGLLIEERLRRREREREWR
jgi:hypothetical protein